jgi:hypothetical protein
MNKITQEMRDALRKPLPDEAISEHPTKTFLSTIKAIYVVERLNDVFGIGEWNISNEIVSKEGKWIIVKAVFTVNGYNIRIEQFGGNDNSDPGDAYKGAATDALTKIGSYLEIGIDVFKGLSNPNKAKKTEPQDQRPPVKEDNRPWLTEKQLDKIVERIKNGEPQLKETATKEFRMKKEYREKILAA